jgi:hypothetical protein
MMQGRIRNRVRLFLWSGLALRAGEKAHGGCNYLFCRYMQETLFTPDVYSFFHDYLLKWAALVGS